MSTIRPFLPPSVPPAGREAARAAPVAPATPVRAAQKAFFQAATAPETRAQPQAEAPSPRRVEPRPVDRLPRPGSLVDIKV